MSFVPSLFLSFRSPLCIFFFQGERIFFYTFLYILSGYFHFHFLLFVGMFFRTLPNIFLIYSHFRSFSYHYSHVIISLYTSPVIISFALNTIRFISKISNSLLKEIINNITMNYQSLLPFYFSLLIYLFLHLLPFSLSLSFILPFLSQAFPSPLF